MLLGLGLLLVTIISGALPAVGRDSMLLFGHRWSLAGVPGAVLYGLGIVGLALMRTAIYMVLPVGQVAFRRALIGGITATLSWEVMIAGHRDHRPVDAGSRRPDPSLRRGGDRRAGAGEKSPRRDPCPALRAIAATSSRGSAEAEPTDRRFAPMKPKSS